MNLTVKEICREINGNWYGKSNVIINSSSSIEKTTNNIGYWEPICIIDGFECIPSIAKIIPKLNYAFSCQMNRIEQGSFLV